MKHLSVSFNYASPWWAMITNGKHHGLLNPNTFLRINDGTIFSLFISKFLSSVLYLNGRINVNNGTTCHHATIT